MRDKTFLSDIDLITITGKPEDVFREMMDAYFRMEQVLATIEILADDEALKAVKKSREEIVKGEYDECFDARGTGGFLYFVLHIVLRWFDCPVL